MNRRQLLTASAVALLVPGTAALASGAKHVNFSREVYDAAIASGEPFMLDFFAPW